MCYPVTCSRCGKTGWGGCGQHVDSVMALVPASQRCTCDTTGTAPEQDVRAGLRSLFRR